MLFARKISIAVALLLSFSSFFALGVSAQSSPRTQTTYSDDGGGGVNVIPYIRGGRQIAFVDFESRDFSNIEYVYFNFNYNTTAQGTKRGVEGSFIPAQEKLEYYNGIAYVRRQLLFGTCSKNVCTYDPNPTDVKITVNTKMKSGPVDQYTRIIAVPN